MSSKTQQPAAHGTISKRLPVPLHTQVLDTIRTNIANEIWRQGERIPSERQLCEVLGVSRATIRRALQSALDISLLRRNANGAVYVPKSAPIIQDLPHIRDFTHTLSSVGRDVKTELLSLEIEECPQSVCLALGVEEASQIMHIRLRGSSDGTIVAIYDSFLPLHFGIRMADVVSGKIRDGVPFTTLELYGSDEIGFKPTAIRQTLAARLASVEIRELMRCDALQPLAVLCTESRIYREHTVVELRIAQYRGDRYKFAIDRYL